ncbi:MAG: alpha/beta hydrolase, partial [Verrucomicrobiales bacterium]
STPSPKGQILRQQIAELGHPLPRLGSIHANLVLLHGRKGRKEDLLPIAERYTALGFRCLIPDLPAHGDSPLPHSQYGSGTFERDLPARLLAELATRHHFDPAPAYLWGLSMGGSFAIHAASQPASPFEKIIVLSSFDQLDGVLTDNAARYLGPFLARHFIAALRQICRARSDFDPAEVRPADRADRLTQPTLVLHGTADQFVATSRGEALHRALASPQKRFLPITDATHDNPLTTPQAVHAAIMEFLLSSTQSKNSHRNSPAHAPSSL